MAHPSAFLHARLPILDGYGIQLLMSATGNHIRRVKRKENHEPFLESKSTGVEHLTSGQCTAYLWMKRDVGRFAQESLYQCSRLLASAHVSGQNLLTFQGIYHVAPALGECLLCLSQVGY
jgi:hypothetical protein